LQLEGHIAGRAIQVNQPIIDKHLNARTEGDLLFVRLSRSQRQGSGTRGQPNCDHGKKETLCHKQLRIMPNVLSIEKN
jgi:hypothetical protein